MSWWTWNNWNIENPWLYNYPDNPNGEDTSLQKTSIPRASRKWRNGAIIILQKFVQTIRRTWPGFLHLILSPDGARFFFFPSRRQWIWARSTENPIFGQGHISEQEILCGPAGGSVRRKCGNHMETILRIRRKEKSNIDNIPELKSFWKRWTSIIVQLSLLLITLMTRRRSRKMSQEQKTLSKWTSSS